MFYNLLKPLSAARTLVCLIGASIMLWVVISLMTTISKDSNAAAASWHGTVLVFLLACLGIVLLRLLSAAGYEFRAWELRHHLTKADRSAAALDRKTCRAIARETRRSNRLSKARMSKEERRQAFSAWHAK
jgi:hypothetical protein